MRLLEEQGNDGKYDELVKAIEDSPARSAWAKGVKEYALTMADEVMNDFSDGEANFLLDTKAFEKLCLNGADDWTQYSWDGNSSIYNSDIAKALSSPSELKRTHDGDWKPNSREEWLDVQARALYQAFRLLDDKRKDVYGL